VSTLVTVVSAGYAEIYRKRLGPSFLYLQAIFDLLLVTAVVHVTNGNASPFSALYILVIATSSLLVPSGGGVLVASLGLVLYFADVAFFLHSPLADPAVWLQLAVIALVALAIRALSTQLRASGEGKDIRMAALERSALQAEDILRNIRSGVITVDATGCLLFANPTAEHLLGIELVSHLGQPVLERIAGASAQLA